MSNSSKQTKNKNCFLGEKLFCMCYSKKAGTEKLVMNPTSIYSGKVSVSGVQARIFISGKPKAVTAFTHLNFRVHEVSLLPVFYF